MPLGCDKQARCKINVQSPEKHQSWQKKITQEAAIALEPALGKGPSHTPDFPVSHWRELRVRQCLLNCYINNGF